VGSQRRSRTMNSRIPFVCVVCLISASCVQDVQPGLANMPPGQESSSASTIEAIRQSLSPADAKCEIKLVEREAPKFISLNGSPERDTVEVCGETRHYEVRRIRMDDNRIMVTAKQV
jgi:hypothetical protein